MRAALTLVAGHGFEAATTAAIAEKAGVAEGTLYRHFPSKDDLLIEVYRSVKNAILAAAEDAQDGTAGPEVRLKHLWRALFDAFRADMAAFAFSQRFMESPLAAREGGVAAERFKAPIAAIRQEGVASGQFADLPPDLMAALFTAPMTYMLRVEAAGRRWKPAELEAAASAVARSWRAA